MKSFAMPILALACCCLPAVLAVAAETDNLALETSTARIDIARSPAPHIARLIHKGSGTAVVARPADTCLFTLVLEKDGKQEVLKSSQAKDTSAALQRADGEVKAVLRFSRFGTDGLSVEVVGACRPTQPLSRWSIRVKSGPGIRLAAVRFPIVNAVPVIGNPDDDFLVLPALPGTLIENPARNWMTGQSVTLQYPGNLSAQFIAYQDRTAGVYMAGMDAGSHPMALAVAKRGDGFAVQHEYTPLAAPGEDWESPYPVALGVTQGAWYDTADLYKQWAVRQPWCAKTLAQRDDVPAWWKAGQAVHVCEVRTYDGRRTCNGSYYAKLPDHLRTFREKIGGPVLAMLAGWENHRRWTAGDYFPIFDEPNARVALRQLCADGFRPFAFLSGLYYTFENEGRDASRIPAAENYLAHFVVDRKTGKPQVFSLNESSPNGSWKRHSYEFCVAVPATHNFFCGVIDRAHALGIDVLQMDQTVQGSGSACYSDRHGHAPGPGLYQTRAFEKLLARMREHGKRLSPEFALFHEEPHEQLIPYLDGFHVREYYEKRWYRAYPGAAAIPLFSYLYHEYAIGYGGDSAGLSRGKNPWLVRCHAMNLATGRTPGAAVWSSHQNALDAHPDQTAMLRNHCRLLRSRAGEYLLLGTMLHPYELDVPMLRYDLDADGKKYELERPAVLTSSWLSPAGHVGHVFVNVSDVKQTVAVGLDTRNVAPPDRCDADIYRSSSVRDFEQLQRNAASPLAFRSELAPGEVVFIEIRPRKAMRQGRTPPPYGMLAEV